MNLTPNETALIRAAVENDYSAGDMTSPGWTWAVIDTTGIDPKVARGALSSLVQKELIHVDGRGDESTVTLTIAGRAAYEAITNPPPAPAPTVDQLQAMTTEALRSALTRRQMINLAQTLLSAARTAPESSDEQRMYAKLGYAIEAIIDARYVLNAIEPDVQPDA